jgi:hypothetical protein
MLDKIVQLSPAEYTTFQASQSGFVKHMTQEDATTYFYYLKTQKHFDTNTQQVAQENGVRLPRKGLLNARVRTAAQRFWKTTGRVILGITLSLTVIAGILTAILVPIYVHQRNRWMAAQAMGPPVPIVGGPVPVVGGPVAVVPGGVPIIEGF